MKLNDNGVGQHTISESLSKPLASAMGSCHSQPVDRSAAAEYRTRVKLRVLTRLSIDTGGLPKQGRPPVSIEEYRAVFDGS
jgi:hypothetical protein